MTVPPLSLGLVLDGTSVVTALYTADESHDMDIVGVKPAQSAEVRKQFARQSMRKSSA